MGRPTQVVRGVVGPVAIPVRDDMARARPPSVEGLADQGHLVGGRIVQGVSPVGAVDGQPGDMFRFVLFKEYVLIIRHSSTAF